MNRMIKWLIVPVVLLSFNTLSQEDKVLGQLQDDERKVVEAIALYPEKERLAILEASKSPEILVRLQRIQLKTSADFKELVAPLSDYDQRQIYNLVRYPSLLNDICEGNKRKSSKELDKLLEGYPPQLLEQVEYLQKRHFDVLLEINHLYIIADSAFYKTLSEYPAETREAYRVLLQLPEVMGVLTENMNMTVLLGDLYKTDPEQLKTELDSLNLVVAEQKAQELKDWQESLENNPEAMAEYQQAAKDFAEEQGYSSTDYGQDHPDNYTSEVYVYHVWQPYPYWFGCPWFYPYDCWYPYPWWYHWGYYYGPNHTIVFVCMPSTYFMYWHFYSGYYHFYRYPHFTDHMIAYHHRHPRSATSVGTFVDGWITENRQSLPKDFFNEDDQRPERIKELGRFNMDYDIATRTEPGKILTKRDFLKEHENEYPSLRPVLREQPEAMKKPVEPTRTNEPKPQTPVQQEKTKVIEKPQSSQQEIERAKTHHERTWETTKPPSQRQPVRQPPVQRAPVQRTPVRTPTPPPAPKKRGG